jgi:hypothetical protein
MLTAREDLASARAFSDVEALEALYVITREKPSVVVVERQFAETPRGVALVNRIKADPSLGACEIRIVAHDGEFARISPRAPRVVEAVVAVAEEPPPSAPVAPLDKRGTRRAARFAIADGVEVTIDGNPATVVDLSAVGAMVVSPTSLRPNQRIRVTLPEVPRPIRLSATVAWASFEMPKGGARYRAGIEFIDVDVESLNRFIEAKKKKKAPKT